MRAKKLKINANEKRLIRRYLIWCYKTTKEDLDRIDRYFTQNDVDRFVMDQLQKTKNKLSHGSKEYLGLVEEFKGYIQKKQNNVLKQKFRDQEYKQLQPKYAYLTSRMTAIEKAIIHFLGAKELSCIIDLYEQEMTQRILQAREHT